MESKFKDFKETTTERQNIYGFLSSIFAKELTAEEISDMIKNSTFELLNESGCNINVNDLKAKSPKKVEEDLACEFTSLFLGPGKHIYAFESAYAEDKTGESGNYWGDSAVYMKKLTKHYDLKINNSLDTIPDHISVELEFMRKIIERENESWETGDHENVEKSIKLQKDFFSKHIKTWIPEFLNQVNEKSNLDFYREIAKITKNFLDEEEKLLDTYCN